jgi:hypothetical protein
MTITSFSTASSFRRNPEKRPRRAELLPAFETKADAQTGGDDVDPILPALQLAGDSLASGHNLLGLLGDPVFHPFDQVITTRIIPAWRH